MSEYSLRHRDFEVVCYHRITWFILSQSRFVFVKASVVLSLSSTERKIEMAAMNVLPLKNFFLIHFILSLGSCFSLVSPFIVLKSVKLSIRETEKR